MSLKQGIVTLFLYTGIIYSIILLLQWTVETRFETYLLTDILEYDKTVLSSIENSEITTDIYMEIYIKIEYINPGTWFKKWNIFEWGESKFIKVKYRQKVLKNLNFWRKTGKLPTYYNLGTKST